MNYLSSSKVSEVDDDGDEVTDCMDMEVSFPLKEVEQVYQMELLLLFEYYLEVRRMMMVMLMMIVMLMVMMVMMVMMPITIMVMAPIAIFNGTMLMMMVMDCIIIITSLFSYHQMSSSSSSHRIRNS